MTPVVRLRPDGKLAYQAWSAQGDVLPDFSNCGYRGGGVRLPDAPVKLRLHPDPQVSDDTVRIQQALDEIGKLPRNADGLRGALLLTRGTYRIAGALRLSASGVVLRGEGQDTNGTVLIAVGKQPRVLIQVRGPSSLREETASRQNITSDYVPVGARQLEVEDATQFKVGDTVIVTRKGNAAWIHELGMDRIKPRSSDPKSTKQWAPFNLGFDRVITVVDGRRVTLDAPLVCAIDRRWGGGQIARYQEGGRIEQVGIENLRGDSEFDASVTREERGQKYPADEQHATDLAGFNHVRNAWARDLTAVHFYHGVATLGSGAKWVTVQDSTSLDPVSVITGGRRYPFNVSGQLCLVQRCVSRDARHAFAVGARVPGPNVFLDCTSTREHATSEPHHRWSTGGLYDNVHANIAFQDRQNYGTGHGWAGANYVAWNCEGTLVCQQPPTAQNFAIGQIGRKEPGAFAPRPDGHWESPGRHVAPRSLYLQQLADRLGPQALQNLAPHAPGLPTP